MNESKESAVYELIKTLTVAEKRNFKELTNYSQSNDKKYLYLFSLLDKSDKYDETDLKTKLKQAGIYTPLSNISNYLQELIYQSLRFYYSDKNIISVIINLLHLVDILHDKGLIKQRDKALLKAKKMAFESEKHNILSEIINKQWLYRPELGTISNSENETVLNNLTIQHQHRQLISERKKLLSKGEVRDDGLKGQWVDLMKHPVMDQSRMPATMEEHLYYHQMWGTFYDKTGDFKKMLVHQEQIIHLLEQHPNVLYNQTKRYVTLLINLITSYCFNYQFDDASITLSKLIDISQQKLNKPDELHLANTIPIVYSNMIYSYINAGYIKKAIELGTTLEVFLQTRTVSDNRKEFVYLTLAKICIYRHEPEKALAWNTKILDVPMDKLRENFYTLAVIYDLIIQFELKALDELPQKIRNATLFLVKRKLLYKTEKLILKYLKNKFPKAYTYRETLYLFIELKTQLEELKKDIYEAKAFEDFDYVGWLRSKIENKSLLEISEKRDKL